MAFLKICQHCKIEFSAEKRSRKFCSRKCQNTALAAIRFPHPRKNVATCQNCGVQFGQYKWNAGKYCSLRCHTEQQRRNPKDSRIVVSCGTCGTSLKRHPHPLNGRDHTYCSRTCAHAGRRKSVTRACDQCKNEFTLP